MPQLPGDPDNAQHRAAVQRSDMAGVAVNEQCFTRKQQTAS